MKKTAAFKPAPLVPPRNEAVSAQRNMRAVVQPQAPMRRNVRLPYLSTKKNVQMLPTIVKVVQHAFSSRGLKPVRPSEA